MKNKCLKLFLLSTPVFILVGLFFFFSPVAKASESIMASQESSEYSWSLSYGGVYSVGQTFTATQDNLSSVSIFVNNMYSSFGIKARVCEVSGVHSRDCLDTPSLSDIYVPSSPDYYWDWKNFGFSTPVSLIIGHFYYFDFSWDTIPSGVETVESYHSDTYTGGSRWSDGEYWTEPRDLVFRLYYNDAPSTYCGDTVCNGSETKSSCPGDCPPSGVLYWNGIDKQVVPDVNGSIFTIPIYYNVCSDYSYIDSVDVSVPMGEGLYPVSPNGTDPYYIIQPKGSFIGPQNCSGFVNVPFLSDGFVNDYNNTGATSTTIDLNLYDSSGNLLKTVVSNSPFILNYFQDTHNGTNYIENGFTSPLNINNTGVLATSTVVHVNYNLNGLSATSSNICLYNENGSITDMCFVASGTADINVGDVNLFLPHNSSSFKGYFADDLITYLHSAVFTLNFTGSDIRAGDTASSTDLKLFGFSTHDMACSADKWATPNPTFSIFGFDTQLPGFFNFTKVGCGFIETLLNIPVMFGDLFNSIFNLAKEFVNSMFPFNLVARVYTSWQTAQITEMPTDLGFIGMAKDSSNQIGFDLPAEWNGTGTTSRVIVFGSSIFVDQNVREATVYAGIRNLTTYFIWGIFILYTLLGLGWRIVNDLSSPKNNNGIS